MPKNMGTLTAPIIYYLNGLTVPAQNPFSRISAICTAFHHTHTLPFSLFIASPLSFVRKPWYQLLCREFLTQHVTFCSDKQASEMKSSSDVAVYLCGYSLLLNCIPKMTRHNSTTLNKDPLNLRAHVQHIYRESEI